MKPLAGGHAIPDDPAVPGSWGTAEEDLAGSVPWFPVVGLLLGARGGRGWRGPCRWSAPPMVAAAVLVVVLLSFSGGLHLDGLADTADGFLSSRPRERILEIMKDSHIGAMGVIAIVCVLLLKFAALASLPAGTALAGRAADAAGRAMRDRPAHGPACPTPGRSGLGAVFYRRRPRWAAVWAVGRAGRGGLRRAGLARAGGVGRLHRRDAGLFGLRLSQDRRRDRRHLGRRLRNRRSRAGADAGRRDRWAW